MKKNKQIICTKKKMDKQEAKNTLKQILAQSGKRPWRDEISTYQCDVCGYYHLSSIPSEYTPIKLRDKSYFELQKEKWGKFLQKHSSKAGNIKTTNKKYST